TSGLRPSFVPAEACSASLICLNDVARGKRQARCRILFRLVADAQLNGVDTQALCKFIHRTFQSKGSNGLPWGPHEGVREHVHLGCFDIQPETVGGVSRAGG